MKKITLLFLLLTASIQNSFSQTEFVGSSQYGRLFNFVYDATIPNKVYATTLTKHVMVSTDNGVTWSVKYSIPNQYYDPTLQYMKLAKNGTALSFVENYGTGSAANKISVLDIATNTIIKQYSMPVASEYRDFRAYSIYDDGTLNTAIILAAASVDKVYYTTDGGVSYTTVYDSVNYEGVILNDVTLDSSNPNKLYIARNGGEGNVDGGLLISSDAGATWTLTLEGLILQSVRVNPTNSNDIFVGTGVRWNYPDQQEALYRSLDGGSTWNAMPITWNEFSFFGGYSTIFSITFNPNNPNQIIALEDNQIIRTTDNGATWQNKIFDGYPDPANFNYYLGEGVAINPNDQNNFFISNNWFPLKTTDGGETTEIILNPFFKSIQNVNVIDLPNEQSLYYGVQYGYVNKNLTTNVETSFDILPIDTFNINGEGYKMIVDKNISGRVYTYRGGFSGNAINVSNDGGITQNTVYSTFDQLLTSAKTDPNNSNIAYFATFNGVNSTLNKIDFSDFNNPTVTEIVLPFNEDYLNCIWIDPTSSNTMLITVGSSLYKSTDGGITWTQVTNGLSELQLPNIGLYIVQNPLNANQLTMAASNGIYTSLDSGNNWSVIYDSFVNRVAHSDKTSGHIVALAYNNYNILAKIVYSNDAGATWSTINPEEFYNSIIVSGDVKFNTNTADVYLATTDLGILKHTISLPNLGTPSFTATDNNLVLYPNPTSGICNLKLKNNETIKTIEVINNLGQKVIKLNAANQFDILNFSAGIYLVRITDTNNNTSISRLIKK